MTNFDADTLRQLQDVREVSIRTAKHPRAGVVIWVVVAGDKAFVRSVYGTRGRWYRDVATGGSATLELAGRQLPVSVVPESDPATVERVSREYLRKYRPSPYAEAMVKSDVLGTTLRIEPH